jgi:hypothetical protein
MTYKVIVSRLRELLLGRIPQSRVCTSQHQMQTLAWQQPTKILCYLERVTYRERASSLRQCLCPALRWWPSCSTEGYQRATLGPTLSFHKFKSRTRCSSQVADVSRQISRCLKE